MTSGLHSSGSGADAPVIPRIAIQAFCETSKLAETMAVAGEDRRMSRVNLRIQMGGAAAAIAAYRSSATPNLVILEAAGKSDIILGHLDELSTVCDAETRVIVIGQINDIVLYRQLISRGVSDYLVTPLEPLEIVTAISNVFSGEGTRAVGRTIAFIGAKGGVGSSTLAHNVAWSIARRSRAEVAIGDFDLPFGTSGLNFNQDPVQGIYDALSSSDRVDVNVIDRLMTRCAEHLSMLASPATLDKAYDFGTDAVDQVLDAMRGHMPVVVLDLPHQWSGWTRRAVLTADRIVLVLSPELASLRNAKNMMDTIRNARPNDPPPDYVLNMVGVPKRPEIKAADFARALGAPPLATVPFDPILFGTAANNGQMAAELEPGSKAVAVINDIAEAVGGRIAGMGADKGGKSGIVPLIGRLLGRSA